MKHLVWALVCVGCGGDSFSAGLFGGDGGADIAEDAAASGDADEPAVNEPVANEAGAGGYGNGGAQAEAGGSSIGGFGGDGAGGTTAGGSPSGGWGGTAGTPSGGVGGTGGDTCETGKTRCAGTQPEVCASGEWFASGTACSGATPVCLDGHCVECEPGVEQCLTSTQPGICDDMGFFVESGPACAWTTPVCVDNECVGCAAETRYSCPGCISDSYKCCLNTGSCGCIGGGPDGQLTCL